MSCCFVLIWISCLFSDERLLHHTYELLNLITAGKFVYISGTCNDSNITFCLEQLACTLIHSKFLCKANHFLSMLVVCSIMHNPSFKSLSSVLWDTNSSLHWILLPRVVVILQWWRLILDHLSCTTASIKSLSSGRTCLSAYHSLSKLVRMKFEQATVRQITRKAQEAWGRWKIQLGINIRQRVCVWRSRP